MSFYFEEWSSILKNHIAVDNVKNFISVRNLRAVDFFIKVKSLSWTQATNKLKNFTTSILF